MNQTQKKFFDSFLKDLKPEHPPLTEQNRKPITIWMPLDYYSKYENIQRDNQRRFTQKIREMIMLAIDNASEG